jgi:chloramphenicol-sensitive protein RarD
LNQATALACVAYLIWGFAALYWMQTEPVSPLDLVAHRALWSVPILALVLVGTGRLRAGLEILRQPRALLTMAASATAQSINWIVFLWAITHQRATDASLGYFLLPLVNVAIGVFLFGEVVDRAQRIAIILAATGMLLLIVENRGLPWVALAVALSFGLYGAIRKQVSIAAVEGLFVETLLMSPLALGWLVYTHGGGFGQYGARVDSFLLGAGVMTVVPLICYVLASRQMPLTSLGLVFYLGPSCQLLVAVCFLGEPLNPIQLFSFGLVWLGLAFMAADSLRRLRSVRRLADG